MAVNDIDIEKLMISVNNAIDDNEKERYDKQKEKLTEYCVKENITQVERIVVKTSYEEIDDNGKMIKTPYCKDEDIVSAIKCAYPEMIDEKIYFFPQGKFYFMTDKNFIFNLRQKKRPLRQNELDQITNWKNELEERRIDLLNRKETAITLHAIYNDKPTEQQLERRNQPESIITALKYDYDNGLIFINNFEHDAKIYLEDKEKTGEKIKQLHSKCIDEPIFSIHPMKPEKQIRIYISSYYKNKFKELGYSIIEQKRQDNFTTWNEQTLSYDENEAEKTSYSFKLSVKAFIGCCKHDKLVQKGYYLNDEGERTLIEKLGINEEVTIIDWNGQSHTFDSKSNAAKYFGVSNAMISKIVSNGGIMSEKPKQKDNKKDFTLISTTNEFLHFNSVSDAALYFNCGISTLSEKMKNKKNGDTVKIKKQVFTLA